ncbi:nuclear transport factor 2 family protein [Actinomycetospora sp. CA-053990]|uniref:nuclear transport factor 2 family protein n=1 Tax=Actinomycetospora sp. CA-053990 TaxID=3239891 RepID=UPI003D89B1BB
MESVDGLNPLAALLRRYAFAYTAAHDFAVCRELMVDDYVLHMGDVELRGRDEEYIPATRKQYRQFPGLGFTVHDLVLGEDRAALHFTEHGRSTLHGGAASWQGVSLYRWNGERLTQCRVEQDYYARRTQQELGTPRRVGAPALDPWSGPSSTPAPGAEEAAHHWLTRNRLLEVSIGSLDDERDAPPRRVLLSNPDTEVLDLFGAGERVAFHVAIRGVYAGGLDRRDHLRGLPATLHASGLLTVLDGAVTDVVAVTDRLAAERRLAALY